MLSPAQAFSILSTVVQRTQGIKLVDRIKHMPIPNEFSPCPAAFSDWGYFFQIPVCNTRGPEILKDEKVVWGEELLWNEVQDTDEMSGPKTKRQEIHLIIVCSPSSLAFHVVYQ